MKVTITKIARFTTKKDGSPLLTQKGKPYTSVRFTCNEYGERWVSGFGNQDNAGWKAGDTVEALIEEKGEYLNFSTPKSGGAADMSAVEAKLEKILNILVGHKIELETIKGMVAPKPKRAYPTAEDEGIDVEHAGEPTPEELNNIPW
jgi:hypothetical protein